MTAINDLLRNFYKEGTSELHWGKVIASVLFALLLLSIGLCNRSKKQKLNSERERDHRYTIGVTGVKHHNIRSSQPTVNFYYEVLGKQYEGTESIGASYEKDVTPNGGRFFVEFSTNNPSNGKLLFDHPVPDYIRSFPDSGWIDITEGTLKGWAPE
ncbi:MAG: hypothetical protein J0M30_13760 [Chitinophagales bacterium]|nr:hypothetical protein [Chitinophagales bacterium]